MATLSRQEVKLYTEFFHQVDETDGDGSGCLSLENCEKLLDNCGHRLPKDAIQAFVSPDEDGSWKLTLEKSSWPPYRGRCHPTQLIQSNITQGGRCLGRKHGACKRSVKLSKMGILL